MNFQTHTPQRWRLAIGKIDAAIGLSTLPPDGQVTQMQAPAVQAPNHQRSRVVADLQVSALLSEAVVKSAYVVIPLDEIIAVVLGGQTQQRDRTVDPARKVLVKKPVAEHEATFTPLVHPNS